MKALASHSLISAPQGFYGKTSLDPMQVGTVKSRSALILACIFNCSAHDIWPHKRLTAIWRVNKTRNLLKGEKKMTKCFMTTYENSSLLKNKTKHTQPFSFSTCPVYLKNSECFDLAGIYKQQMEVPLSPKTPLEMSCNKMIRHESEGQKERGRERNVHVYFWLGVTWCGLHQFY